MAALNTVAAELQREYAAAEQAAQTGLPWKPLPDAPGHGAFVAQYGNFYLTCLCWTDEDGQLRYNGVFSSFGPAMGMLNLDQDQARRLYALATSSLN